MKKREDEQPLSEEAQSPQSLQSERLNVLRRMCCMGIFIQYIEHNYNSLEEARVSHLKDICISQHRKLHSEYSINPYSQEIKDAVRETETVNRAKELLKAWLVSYFTRDSERPPVRKEKRQDPPPPEKLLCTSRVLKKRVRKHQFLRRRHNQFSLTSTKFLGSPKPDESKRMSREKVLANSTLVAKYNGFAITNRKLQLFMLREFFQSLSDKLLMIKAVIRAHWAKAQSYQKYTFSQGFRKRLADLNAQLTELALLWNREHVLFESRPGRGDSPEQKFMDLLELYKLVLAFYHKKKLKLAFSLTFFDRVCFVFTKCKLCANLLIEITALEDQPAGGPAQSPKKRVSKLH